MRSTLSLSLAVLALACGGKPTQPSVREDARFADYKGTWILKSSLGRDVPYTPIATQSDTSWQVSGRLDVSPPFGAFSGAAQFRDSAYSKSYLGSSLGWRTSNHTMSGSYRLDIDWLTGRLVLKEGIGSAPTTLYWGLSPSKTELIRYLVGNVDFGQVWVRAP